MVSEAILRGLEDPTLSAGMRTILEELAALSAASPAVFLPSGPTHHTGLVPDPGAVAGTTKFLREDATFAVPAGGVASVTATAPITSTGGATPDIAVNDFIASGASHKRGAVPDPGATAGTTRFLREDAAFVTIPANGSVPSAWTWVRSNPTIGTVYQNTNSRAIMIIGAFFSGANTTNVDFLTDASNPPTTSTARCSMAAGNYANFAAWVLPNHYYKITNSAGTMAYLQFTTYTLARGTVTGSGNLSGSRAYTTVYQNTGGSTLWVQGKLGSGGTSKFLSDASNPPTTQVWSHGVTGGSDQTFLAPVLPGHYYELTNTGAGSIVAWNEYTWDTVVVKRSRSYPIAGGGRGPLTTVQDSNNSNFTRSYINTGGLAVFGIYSSSMVTGNVFVAIGIEGANGPGGDQTFTQSVKPNNDFEGSMCFDYAGANVIRCLYYGLVPMDVFMPYEVVTSAETRQNWFEWSVV